MARVSVAVVQCQGYIQLCATVAQKVNNFEICTCNIKNITVLFKIAVL